MERVSRSDYIIHLNFLPILNSPEAVIFRTRREESEPRPDADVFGFHLPSDPADEDWLPYWVSFCPKSGFDTFRLPLSLNRDLGRRLIFDTLINSVGDSFPSDDWMSSRSFLQEVALTTAIHPEGREELVLQPYFLAEHQRFGFLADFHFRLNPDVTFNRRIQQLSLSLNRMGRRNTDYYIDRTSKVRAALIKHWRIFEQLRLNGSGALLSVSKEYSKLRADKLAPKVFLFRGERQKQSQFAGLKEYGPLQPLEAVPRLLFIFREQDRQPARRLAMAIRGNSQQSRFVWPGFESIFKTPIEIDPRPAILPDLTRASMEAALKYTRELQLSNPSLLPVLVLPTGDDNGYLEQKAIFSNSSLPTQVCTLRILEDDETLKWAVANLALQMFCKLGGKPWKVKSHSERSLIVGISHSHKLRNINGKNHVEKYFAFSVLTDSTGLFQRIEVLGDESSESSYLDMLRRNLRSVLQQESSAFDRVVVHTSFKLNREEIDAIQATVSEAGKSSQCKFSVIKVNHKTRFFGTHREVNSLVPYEGTKLKLGPREYLVWFEGLSPDKPNVTKAYPGPTHLQLLPVREVPESPAEEQALLQELVDLSGANWRGFNAKSSPVSVFYCHLVADLVHEFYDHNLPLPASNDTHPWFL